MAAVVFFCIVAAAVFIVILMLRLWPKAMYPGRNYIRAPPSPLFWPEGIFKRRKFFYLQLELFLLTVKLLCLQSLKALITLLSHCKQNRAKKLSLEAKSSNAAIFAICDCDAHRGPQKSLAISETLHCDLRVRWKVASDLRFRVAISEPDILSFCGTSGDFLAPSPRKSLAIAIVPSFLLWALSLSLFWAGVLGFFACNADSASGAYV